MTLLDHDADLLEEVERRIGQDSKVGFRRHDLNDIDGLPLDGIAVVTASALFDLCSERFCEAVADRLASARIGLYAALTYDGTMDWSLPHPLDGQMVDLFNRHQRTDKGFGPALGPDATACLARQFAARGFNVTIGESPWRLDAGSTALQVELLNGLRRRFGKCPNCRRTPLSAGWKTAFRPSPSRGAHAGSVTRTSSPCRPERPGRSSMIGVRGPVTERISCSAPR